MDVDAARVELRPATDDDRDLLRAIYESTRTEEMAIVPWSDEQKRAFLQWQFDAQDHSYRTNMPDATFEIIVDDGQDVGRLYLDERPGEIRVVDIALLPVARGRGIGTRLLREVQQRAGATGRSVVLHVEPQSPARRLYERLGFVAVADSPAHVRMEWTPPPA